MEWAYFDKLSTSLARRPLFYVYKNFLYEAVKVFLSYATSPIERQVIQDVQ